MVPGAGTTESHPPSGWPGTPVESPIPNIPNHCAAFSKFSDEMPSPVVDSLLRLPYNVGDSVGVDRTYANGARCLIDFIKLKREMYNRSR